VLIACLFIHTVQEPYTSFRSFLFSCLRLRLLFRLLFWKDNIQMHNHLIIVFQPLNRTVLCPRDAALTFVAHKLICAIGTTLIVQLFNEFFCVRSVHHIDKLLLIFIHNKPPLVVRGTLPFIAVNRFVKWNIRIVKRYGCKLRFAFSRQHCYIFPTIILLVFSTYAGTSLVFPARKRTVFCIATCARNSYEVSPNVLERKCNCSAKPTFFFFLSVSLTGIPKLYIHQLETVFLA